MDLPTVLNRAKSLSVAVIGDVCLDLYYHSHQSSELSVETGLPVQQVSSYTSSPGGAAQVAALCKSIGFGRVELFGVIGEDAFGREIRRIMDGAEVSCDHLLTQEQHWDTHVYHKFFEGKEELPRYDFGSNNSLSAAVEKNLISYIRDSVDSFDVIIINQQQKKGLHTPSFISLLNACIQESKNPTKWICDARHLHKEYPHCMHKMNFSESKHLVKELALTLDTSQHNSDQALVFALAKYWQYPVIITMGQYGAIAHDTHALYEENGIHIIKEVDAVGAGDAFLAGLALSVAGKSSLQDALHVANLAAGVFIQPSVFPEGLTQAALLDLGRDVDHTYNYNLAQDFRRAVYYKDSEIEIINVNLLYSRKKEFPKYAIFDLDGTISSLREGWEVVMRESMLEFIAGPTYMRLSVDELRSLNEKIEILIKKTTGVQTIIQMVEMCHLIRDFGYVKVEDMFTPDEYKELYANKIRAQVKRKIGRFNSGALHLEDFTIKGALAFVQKLRDEGVTVYLASGTDQTDVIHELQEFGYSHLFNGGIFGSVGDTENDPKKLVMQTIRERIEQDGGELQQGDCVVFGDGPVEIREGRKQGFVTVGLVSDEKQRYGMNLNKRERLILAGADFLLPDYSWSSELYAMLGWE